jgi:prephenate dehydrogenase
MWLAICQANREAIVAGLDEAIFALSQFRRAVADGDRDELLNLLDSAKLRRDTWLRPVDDD